MISVIVFSKDRPLQLHAYLESLMYYSNIKPEYISVLYKDSDSIPYTNVIEYFKDVNFIHETVFIDDLYEIIQKSHDYILFGCDDVIYTDKFDPNIAIEALSSDESIFGFCFRLGVNIKPFPVNRKILYKGEYLTYDWDNVDVLHWDYPWELDGTLYRKSDIISILSKIDIKILSNPNYLEATISKNLKSYTSKTKMAAYKRSKCLVVTVNRVQDYIENDYDDSKGTGINALYREYVSGNRMLYKGLPINNQIHVGSEYFILQSDNTLVEEGLLIVKSRRNTNYIRAFLNDRFIRNKRILSKNYRKLIKRVKRIKNIFIK